MSRKTLRTSIVAVSLLAMNSAGADDMVGFYAGFGAGATRVDDFCDDVRDLASAVAIGFGGAVGTSCDDEDTGWKVFGGARLSPNLALELGYVDLGEADVDFRVEDTFGNANVEVDAFVYSLLLIYPVSESFSIFGKVGGFYWDAEAEATVVGFGSADADENGTDLMFGVGGAFNITKNISVRAEWERYNDIEDYDVDMLSGSVVYMF